ncbi:hypothetical protein HTK96_15020 [Brevundimonas vesicularis]|uniref:hypothetical protein n=1 Tax=Brevundimonas vesicularis TaxID=41276 RepID=UPI001573DD10|nr:hypothetical protein [Brevundimonas vesicularis]NSX34681.1 hypothetical protein [Brevundimonas vesicularis]
MIASLLLALAQEPAAPDLSWTATKRDGLVAASVEYDVGLTLSTVCQNGRFMFAVGGLPAMAGSETTRKLDVSLRGPALASSSWSIAPNSYGSVVLAPAPSIYARHLRSADQFTVRIPAEGDRRAQRYELALPRDHAALDQAMTACNVALENAADAIYDPRPQDVVWAVPPRITPPPTLPSATYAEALIQCSVDGRGRPEDCALLDENPPRSGFGRHALRMVTSGRVERIDGAPVQAGGVFTTRMTCTMTEH